MADTLPRRFHSYRPADGHRLPHDPFNAIIGPRPIGWISSRDAESNVNLAPYSFFNAFNYTPPIIGFSSQGRKDSLRNIEATGEFVWNLATFDLAQAMNESCRAVAPEVDEFALAGLTPLASEQVAPPRVAQSPVSMECRCTQIVRLRDAAGNDTMAGWYWEKWSPCISIRGCSSTASTTLQQATPSCAAADRPTISGSAPSNASACCGPPEPSSRRPTGQQQRQ